MVVEYTELVDANEADCSYNLYGVLLNFSRIVEVSKKKKRSHRYYISYTVIDPSQPGCDHAVVVNIFANDVASLVEPAQIGAIIRLHGVKLSVFGPWQKRIFVGSMVNPGGSKDPLRGSGVVLFERCVDPCTGLSGTTVARRDIFDLSQWVIRSSAGSEYVYAPNQATAAHLMALDKWVEEQFLVNIRLQTGLHVRSQIARSLFAISTPPAPPAEPAVDTVPGVPGGVTMAPPFDPTFDCVCMLVAVLDGRSAEDQSPNNVALYLYDGSGPDWHDPRDVESVDGVNPTTDMQTSAAVTHLPAPCTAFNGPTFCHRANHIFQGMKNAALFSDCTAITAKRELDATLGSPPLGPRTPGRGGRSTVGAGVAADTTNTSANLFGQLYKITCATESDCSYVTQTLRLRPGMWLRIRGAHADSLARTTTDPRDGMVTCIGELRFDSAVGILLPHFNDASSVAAGYFNRLAKLQRVANTGPLTVNVAFTKYMPLSLCLSSAPPAEFRCRVRIVNFFPRNVPDFVKVQVTNAPQNTNRRGGNRGKGKVAAKKVKTHVYMFSLRIADDSGTADVICYEHHAQCLLGGTPPEAFCKQGSVRRAVADALEQCICSGRPIDMNLWSYSLPVKPSTTLRGQKAKLYAGCHQYQTRLKVVHTPLLAFAEGGSAK